MVFKICVLHLLVLCCDEIYIDGYICCRYSNKKEWFYIWVDPSYSVNLHFKIHIQLILTTSILLLLFCCYAQKDLSGLLQKKKSSHIKHLYTNFSSFFCYSVYFFLDALKICTHMYINRWRKIFPAILCCTYIYVYFLFYAL